MLWFIDDKIYSFALVAQMLKRWYYLIFYELRVVRSLCCDKIFQIWCSAHPIWILPTPADSLAKIFNHNQIIIIKHSALSYQKNTFFLIASLSSTKQLRSILTFDFGVIEWFSFCYDSDLYLVWLVRKLRVLGAC